MGILSFIRLKTRCHDNSMNRNELIKILEDFLQDTGKDEWAWDDLISYPKKDDNVEKVRQEILYIEQQHPADVSGWCSETGLKKIIEIVRRLKEEEW